jgi:hypothetical protein
MSERSPFVDHVLDVVSALLDEARVLPHQPQPLTLRHLVLREEEWIESRLEELLVGFRGEVIVRSRWIAVLRADPRRPAGNQHQHETGRIGDPVSPSRVAALRTLAGLPQQEFPEARFGILFERYEARLRLDPESAVLRKMCDLLDGHIPFPVLGVDRFVIDRARDREPGLDVGDPCGELVQAIDELGEGIHLPADLRRRALRSPVVA